MALFAIWSHVSSEILQKRLNQELEGLPGVKCIADDVLIYDTDEADHDRNLANLMCRMPYLLLSLHITT